MEKIKSVLVGAGIALFLNAVLFSMMPQGMPKNAENIKNSNTPPAIKVDDIKVPQYYKITDELIDRFVEKKIVSFGRSNPMKFSKAEPASVNTQGETEQENGTDNNASQGGIKPQISGYVLPVDKDVFNISSRYGYRIDPFTKELAMHHGVDIGAADENGKSLIEGKPVYAFLGGRVLFAGDKGDLGNTVVIDHGNIKTTYGHLKSIDASVKVGEMVSVGQVIGTVGNTGRSTGPHLHFELSVGDTTVDPLPYLEKLAQK